MENARRFEWFLFQASVQEMDTYNKVVIIYSIEVICSLIHLSRHKLSKSITNCLSNHQQKVYMP